MHSTGIGGSPLTGNLIDKTARAATAEKAAPVAGSATKSVNAITLDAAALSGAGSLLAASATTDDVRTEKVESIKAAIANGTYNVPAADVADTLIGHMLE